MALTIACASDRVATVEEVIEQADRLRDLDDPNSIAARWRRCSARWPMTAS